MDTHINNRGNFIEENIFVSRIACVLYTIQHLSMLRYGFEKQKSNKETGVLISTILGRYFWVN